MPKVLEDCVKHLMTDPNFKPRKKGQSKKSAAFAVCTASLAKKRASSVAKQWRK